ncbi:hypothetical protein [Fodinicurvata sp. EGI_FJ10296]|uniref:hypothetical protein n=1 Tax=Fodinicurvata sp. EGI_FJ10296 TaxID=3231908 RepID=UPI00345215F4
MTTMTMKAPPDELVAERLRGWLRAYSAKDVARQLDIRLRTVEAWRVGQTSPNLRYLTAMIALWGEPFVRDIFAPVLEDDGADLPKRLERLEHELRSIRSDYNELAKNSARPRDDDDRGVDRQTSATGSGRSGSAAKAARSMGRSMGVMALAALSGWSTIDSEAMRTTTRSGSRPPITRSVRVARMTAADGVAQA